MKKSARKTRKQLIAEKTAASKKLVDAANALKNPLKPSFSIYKAPDGSVINLRCCKVADLDEKTIAWVFDLMERNMKKMYQQTKWGWNAEEKQKELTEAAAWYLIASTESGELVGFSHFRFDMDYGIEVLYCYELQLEPTARRKGLGRCMMTALESMAFENHMQKVALTVFSRNSVAVTFFHSVGYTLDKTSPEASENVHYVILSKKHLPSVRNATSIEEH